MDIGGKTLQMIRTSTHRYKTTWLIAYLQLVNRLGRDRSGRITQEDAQHRVQGQRRHSQLCADYRAGRGHVLGRAVHIRLLGQSELSARAAESAMSAEDLPSEYRSGGKRVPEHSAGGLEAGCDAEVCADWAAGKC